MAYTLDQLSQYYDALANRIQGTPTSTQINDLTDLIAVQHQTILDLIAAITTRIQSIEDWKLSHIQDADAHSE